VVLAEKFKNEGNEFFKKKGEFEKALTQYEEAWDYADVYKGTLLAVEIVASSKLNASLIHTKQKNFKKAIELASEVLKDHPKHTKALFRRAQAKG